MTLEAQISTHYTEENLLARILAALRDGGISPADVKPEDLKSVDEFHVGGIAATSALIEQLDLAPGMRVLDIGSGIGGTARVVARQTGAHVSGIDLTPEYTGTAVSLSEMVKLDALTAFQTASALAMPFADESFDAALMLHVGMNIADKDALMIEVARVLEPGAVFAIYDIMKVGPEPISFPMPWAGVAEHSFLETLEGYRSAAREAGFSEVSSRDRTEVALDFFAEQKRRAEAAGSPALGLHILMGPEFPTKVANLVSNIAEHRLAPTELILRLDRNSSVSTDGLRT